MSAQLSADIVVIGAGIVGALAARRLAKQGASVLILEAGPRLERARIVAAFRNSPIKGNWMAPYPPSPWAPHPIYVPIKSLYGVGVDWPLSYEELDPWYQEAEELLGVAGADDTGSPRQHPFPMEPVAEPWAMRRVRE